MEVQISNSDDQSKSVIAMQDFPINDESISILKNDGKIIGADGFTRDMVTDHFSVFVLDLTFKKDSLHHYKRKIQSVNLFFVLEGSISGKENDEKKGYHFNDREHLILNRISGDGYVSYKANLRTTAVLIRFSPDFLREKLKGINDPKVQEFLRGMNSAISFSKQNGTITKEMLAVLQEIRNTTMEGDLLKIFLEAKVLELLFLQLEYFIFSNNSEEETVILSQFQFDEFVQYLKEIRFGSVSREQIAQKFSLNVNQLEKEIRRYTGKSFSRFWKYLNMEEIRRKLSSGAFNIKQAAWHGGYSHTQHFSTTFKKEFGISPSEVKRV